MKRTPTIIFFLALVALAAFIVFTRKTEAPLVPISNNEIPQTPKPASKDDLIVLTSPLPGSDISSPLTITGRARGNWFFEGSFPVMLVDWDGLIIAEGYATAQGEWMVEDYVPFKGEIIFTKPNTQVSNRGWLVLKKDNPSGEPRFDNALEVEIHYK